MALSSEFMDRFRRVAFRAGVEGAIAQTFLDAYATLSPLEASRINTPQFAARAGMSSDTALTLLVAGAREGLFSFEWGLVCPMCGGFAHTLDGISEVAESFHCGFCDITVPTTLDESMEVTFSCPASQFDPHATLCDHVHYLTSQSFPYRQEMADYHHRNTVSEARIDPGHTAVLTFRAEAGTEYRLITLDTHAMRVISVLQPSGARPGSAGAGVPDEVVLDNTGFCGPGLQVAPGDVQIGLTNRLDDRVWVQVIRVAVEEIQDFTQVCLPPRPRLSGKQLLTNQTFRDLFGIQDLIADLHIKVQAITVLFTDLKGSTELYDRAGDLPAYDLVQRHFQVLREPVAAESGAIIKTMGDAIMAAFPEPRQAVRAAMAMMDGMKELSDTWGNGSLGLKVGIHTGPALTVNTGGALDFFGQTVNVAARIQGLADAGEIVLSSAVEAGASDTRSLLAQGGYTVLAETSRLKGVSESYGVLRCVRGERETKRESAQESGLVARLRAFLGG